MNKIGTYFQNFHEYLVFKNTNKSSIRELTDTKLSTFQREERMNALSQV